MPVWSLKMIFYHFLLKHKFLGWEKKVKTFIQLFSPVGLSLVRGAKSECILRGHIIAIHIIVLITLFKPFYVSGLPILVHSDQSVMWFEGTWKLKLKVLFIKLVNCLSNRLRKTQTNLDFSIQEGVEVSGTTRSRF